ncbi:hypothetical protein LM602_07110 [Candidatus Acetothermia bacterium]|jgi:hypothetical protein|nr:hypothetical protein [Candidatus Acetothermia bacterium]MCI2432303.1 hypothetical protein [Candidatus Acetothermia bacterium]MCI2437428.1 hypothetical protein [Candidatus Acetothermia bacterium]
MSKQVEFSYNLDTDVRYRHFQQVERGKVIWYVVQLEVQDQGRWKPVRRHDCVHERSHIDEFNRQGERRRIWLDIDYSRALTQGQRDLHENWERYRERFLEGRFPT